MRSQSQSDGLTSVLIRNILISQVNIFRVDAFLFYIGYIISLFLLVVNVL